MKVIKIIIGIVIALDAVLAIAIFIGLKNLDSLVEMAIESVGTDVTKTPVTVDGVTIELTDGRGEIQGISVKNPAGYTTENAIHLGQILLEIEPASIADDVIVIKQLTVNGAALTAEHKGLADINLQQIYDNITADSGKTPKDPAPTTARPDVRFMLEKVSFTNMSLDLLSTEFGERQLSMDDIQLSNLGDRQTGLTAEELANVLLTPVVDAARKKVNNELRNEAKEKLQENLEENLSDDDKQTLDKLKSWLDK